MNNLTHITTQQLLKVFSVITTLILLFIPLFLPFVVSKPKSVFADGAGIYYNPYSKRWDYVDETSQEAYIFHDGTNENLLISVDLESADNHIFWLIPIPADPSKIDVDILTNLPKLQGEELNLAIRANNADTLMDFALTQVYPIPFLFFMPMMFLADGAIGSAGSFGGVSMEQARSDVTVHSQIEKAGMLTEVVTAKNSGALVNYISEKGFVMDENAIPALNEYIGQDYSFVVSHLAPPPEAAPAIFINENNLLDPAPPSPQQTESSQTLEGEGLAPILERNTIRPDYAQVNLANSTRAVVISFPTEEIFYPLRLTSAYGETVIPTTVRVFGYVTPKPYSELAQYIETEYYAQKWYGRHEKYLGPVSLYGGTPQRDVLNNQLLENGVLKYTKIAINAPSTAFTDDLWIDNSTPLETHAAYQLYKYPTQTKFVLFAFASMFAAFFAGILVYRRDLVKTKRWLWKLLGLGLANFFTLIGVFIGTFLISFDQDSPEAIEILSQLKAKKYVLKRRLAFVLLVPTVIFGLAALPLLYALLLGLLMVGVDDVFALMREPLFIPYVVGMIGSVFIIRFLRKVNAEDVPLFTQLKNLGYSTLTLRKVGERRIVFVVLFSILFLLFTYLFLTAIKATFPADFPADVPSFPRINTDPNVYDKTEIVPF